MIVLKSLRSTQNSGRIIQTEYQGETKGQVMMDHKGTDSAMMTAFAQYFHDTDDMIFFKDIDLRYTYASHAFLELVGMDHNADITGLTDTDLFQDPKLIAKYAENDRWMIENGESMNGFVETLPEKDGKPRFSYTTKNVIRDADGRIIGLYGI